MQLAWKIATSPSLSRNYADLAGASRPVHLQDAFSLRHPATPAEKRAKLFQPGPDTVITVFHDHVLLVRFDIGGDGPGTHMRFISQD